MNVKLLFKSAGVLIFIWILSRIDRNTLLRHIGDANTPLLIAGLLMPIPIYAVRTVRWKVLVNRFLPKITLGESWRMYYIGIFLACITPGKIGEFGKAAYLHAHGLPKVKAVSLPVLERVMDIAAVSAMTVVACGILFDARAAVIAAFVMLLGFGVARTMLSHVEKRQKLTSITAAIREFSDLKGRGFRLASLTTGSWFLHFVWAIVIAKSIGIDTSIPLLFSILTIVGIVSFLPVAPSGLGTREAALITLLGTQGIAPEKAVALGFLMFISILLTAVPGGIYWMKGMKTSPTPLQ